MRALAALLLVLAACGSGGGSGGDDDGGGADASDLVDAAPPDGGTATVTCGELTCGTTSDSGDTVICDRCRFSADPIAEGFVEAVALAMDGGEVHVGYDDVVATRGAGWDPETLPAGEVSDLAIDAAGVRWALLDSGGDLAVANDAAGTWVVEDLANGRPGARLALGSDGTVFVAFSGGGDSLTQVPAGLVIARRSGGVWSYQSVAPIFTFSLDHLDIAVVAGEPWIAWADGEVGSLKLSTSSAGTFTTETVDDNLPIISEHDLALAIDAAGRPHIVYRQNSPMFREIHHAVRDGGAWVRETVAVLRNSADGDVRMAIAPDGDLAVVFVDTEGLSLAIRTQDRWFRQQLAFGAIAADLAFDGDGVLHVVHANRDSEVQLVSRAGAYPSDYDVTCDELATTLCAAACDCTDDCCIESASGGFSCSSPKGFCVYAVDWQACGDAHQDPALAYACHEAAATATCEVGTPLFAPAACPQF